MRGDETNPSRSDRMNFGFSSGAGREHQAVAAAVQRAQAVISFELDGTIIDANDNFPSVMGYTLDEIKGRHHRMFAEPGFAASAAYEAFWNDLRRGEFKSAQYKRIGKGGKEVWIEASYNPLFDRSGKPYKVVKFATDVTEQVVKNAFYKGQIEAIDRSQAVIQFELDGTIVQANENFLSAMGYSAKEIAGQHHRMFVESAHAASAEYTQFWRDLGNGQFKAGEFKRLGKGGQGDLDPGLLQPDLRPERQAIQGRQIRDRYYRPGAQARRERAHCQAGRREAVADRQRDRGDP